MAFYTGATVPRAKASGLRARGFRELCRLAGHRIMSRAAPETWGYAIRINDIGATHGSASVESTQRTPGLCHVIWGASEGQRVSGAGPDVPQTHNHLVACWTPDARGWTLDDDDTTGGSPQGVPPLLMTIHYCRLYSSEGGSRLGTPECHRHHIHPNARPLLTWAETPDSYEVGGAPLLVTQGEPP